MDPGPIARHRTALTRHELSRPVRLAIEDGLIGEADTVFDYGCGRGGDVRILRGRGIRCAGWDPNFYPESERAPADVVNLGYVVNVIENQAERASALKQAWSLARRLLVVSARLSTDSKNRGSTPFEDGHVTRRSTFQKYYDQQELRTWIDSVLGEASLPASPGIFYVFRDENARESFVASKYRRTMPVPHLRHSDILYEKHKALFESLIAFVASRGRVPDDSELETAEEIKREVGSIKRAFAIIRRVTGNEQWEKIREERLQDLLIYIALSRFSRRPRMAQLSTDLQLDIRAFFSTYSRACELGDQLLFSAGNTETIMRACRESTVGKLTMGSLYVHVSAVSLLPPVLRVYEGCARAYIGSVEGANLVKLKHKWPQVSYLSYPDFERDPHPALRSSLIVPLQTFRIQHRDYQESANPPILHRKETFIAADHPLSEKFARLTRQEEKFGLYEDTRVIGTRAGWEDALQRRGVTLSGHRVVKRKQQIDN